MDTVRCAMDPREALAELIAVVSDPDFEHDAAAMLAAWAALAGGEVAAGDRWRPTEGNLLTDYIAHDPEPVER